MAQIIKYANGGSASNSSSNKYGTFTIDNQTYQVDDNFINQLYEYEKTLDPRVGQQFGHIIDAVKNGENITYNSSGMGSITGNINFDVTDKQNSRMDKSRRRFGSFLGNAWNGKEQTAREAISALKNFNYSAPAPAQTKYDWSRSLQAEYAKDNNGKYVVNNGARTFINGANNVAILNRISKLAEIANYKDSDIFQGYGNLDKQAYINLYNHLGKDGVQGLYDRVKNGTWTDADADALDDIGIFLRESDDSSSGSGSRNGSSEDEATLKNRFANAGLNYDLSSPYITIDENGAIRTTDAFNQAFGTNNGIYNDWWQSHLSKTQQWNPDFSWLKGYTRIGNRLYKTSDLDNENSELYQFAHQDGGFYDLNRQNKFKEANQILEYLWGRSDESSSWDNNQYYNKWMSQQDPNTFRYRSLNGTVELPEGQQLIEYWSGDERDSFGRPSQYKYALFDNNGNLISDNVDINKYKSIDGEQQAFSAISRITDPDSPYKGMYIKKFTTPGGDVDNMWLFTNPENPSDMIYYSRDLWGKNAINNHNIRIPKELASAINNNPEFWNRLLADKTLQERFNRSLLEGVASRVGTWRNLTGAMPLSVSDLMTLGFDQNTAQNVFDYLENTWYDKSQQNKRQRQYDRLVAPYVEPTQSIESHQTGGRIGTTTDVKAKDKTQKVSDYKDIQKVAGAHDDWNLSSADKLELASLAGDIASLVASIPTGGNPLAGALGYGSSLTQFAADIKRDGFDMKDLGGLAVNLGLDTVTLLPGIGIGGKSAKLIKSVKKVAKPLKNALLAVGAVQGVQGVTNLVNGNGTIDDWKNVLNGLQAVVGGRRVYKDIKATKYKGKAPKAEAKTKTQLRNEYVDQVVKEKGLGKDKPIDGIDSNGNITDYEKAIASLTKSGDLKISKAQEAKWAAEAAGSSTKAGLKNLFSSSYNPLSSNYRFRMSNRQLPEDFNSEQLAGNTSKLRTIGRVATENPEIAAQLRNKGWGVPETFDFSSNYGGNWFYRSPVFTRPKVTPKITDTRFLLPKATSTPVTNTPVVDVPKVAETPVTVNVPKIENTRFLLPGRSQRLLPSSNLRFLLPVSKEQLLLPSSNIRFLLPRSAGQWVSLPNGQGMVYRQQSFKKGGKIIKAYNGMVFPTFSTVLDEMIPPRSNTPTTTPTSSNTSVVKTSRVVPKMNYDFTDQWNADFGSQLGNTNYIGTTGSPRIRKKISPSIITESQNRYNNTPTINYNFTNEWNKEFGDILGKSDYIGTNPIIHENNINERLTEFNLKPSDNTNDVKVQTDPPTKHGGMGLQGLLDKLNPDMFLGLSDFILSSRGINRSANKMKEAIRKGMIGSQQQMPTEIYPTFTDNGLHRMYDQRLNNIRRYKTVTSDPREALAERLMRDSMADQIAAERDTKFSQIIDNYRNQMLGLKQQYADQRRQIADSNRNKWAQGEAQLAMTEANRIGQQTQNWKNLIYQTRQNYARDLERRNALEDKLLGSNNAVQYRNKLKKLFDSKGGFASMSAKDKETYGLNWDRYTEDTFMEDAANLKNSIVFNSIKQQANDPRRQYSWVPLMSDLSTPQTFISPSTTPQLRTVSNKRGGTIKRYRDVDEQHYLDQQKAINKAVNDLNNNIIKLFSKMMS